MLLKVTEKVSLGCKSVTLGTTLFIVYTVTLLFIVLITVHRLYDYCYCTVSVTVTALFQFLVTWILIV